MKMVDIKIDTAILENWECVDCPFFEFIDEDVGYQCSMPFYPPCVG